MEKNIEKQCTCQQSSAFLYRVCVAHRTLERWRTSKARLCVCGVVMFC